ncbi:MAG: braG [Frankiales bacterium]|nr:braG [Frankiales bacterium]
MRVLEVTDLRVTYGGAVEALRGVSLSVPDGKVVAVLGSNGAGKTTLLRAVSSILRLHKGKVESGSITFDGKDLRGRDPSQCVSMGLVQVPEGRRIFSRLTVEENLRAGGMGARDKSAKKVAHERVYDLFPVLAERRHGRAGLLSGGEQQMLAIGRALMAGPKLLLLDEPSLGLAPRIIGQIGDIISEINRQGTSVLLVEQNATMALGVADLAYVLDVGEVSLQGDAKELAATDEVQKLYLGHGADDDGSRPVVASGKTLSRWTA